jgi:hypothetical protein
VPGLAASCALRLRLPPAPRSNGAAGTALHREARDAARRPAARRNMTDDEAFEMERRLWTGDEAVYRDAVDDACVMAFPAPAGILTGPRIVQSLKAAPRWSSIDMAELLIARPARDLLVLAYRAEARRTGASSYSAYCTSTYFNAENRWRLVQHQQTPL